MKTTISILALAALGSLSVLPAMAQGHDDLAYCRALTNKYEKYVAGYASGRHGSGDQNAAANVAIDQCKAGDASGIATLERVLQNAGFSLPARG